MASPAFRRGPETAHTLPAKLQRLIRAFALVWGRLGSARIYVALLAGAFIALATLGFWHLVSPRKQTAPAPLPLARAPQSPSPSRTRTAAPSPVATPAPFLARSPSASSSSPIPSAPPIASESAKEVAITDVTQSEKRGRRGETFVVATIGISAHSNLEKGGVEIHVFFYDLTANNEMRPTDAQVTYQWLTPVRDWSDPAPKYLAATYLKRPTRHRSWEKLRYGGFVVRVFAGGKLQDERSEPEGLLSFLRSNASQTPGPATAPSVPPPSVMAPSVAPPKNVATTKTAPTKPTPVPGASPPPTEKKTSQDSSLPYGKPVPRKPGFVSSPFDAKFIIDVRGFPPGTLVNDPNTNKPFRVP